MPTHRSRSWRADIAPAIAVIAVLVWSWFASGVRTFTRPAEILTFVPAFAVLVLTLWPRSRGTKRSLQRRRKDTPYSARGVAVWLALLVAVIGWEMFQLFSKPRERHPTISSLLNTLISTHPSRFAGYLLWLIAGGLLVRDVVAPRE
jgi:amino acid transporter